MKKSFFLPSALPFAFTPPFFAVVFTILVFLALSVFSPGAPAQTMSGPFSLPPLPYEYSALDAAIDEETMRLHHGKHHQAYIDKLNEEVSKNEALAGQSLEEILAAISNYNSTVRNNAGGHWNHSFFWTIMAPPAATGAPSENLLTAIEEQFGSLDDFKAAFNQAGINQFGSGWVWLIVTPSGDLKITSTPNQDNPLMSDAPDKGTPLLGNDLWEHAYYLRYQNRRADYMQGWWDVVNWARVSDLYEGTVK